MKKGFTLIELLAVIVVLAIIALIATPIVLGIINDSKESAILRSEEFYVDAVKNGIMKKNLELNGTLTFPN
jgi:type IV pilus assembly protein PilA